MPGLLSALLHKETCMILTLVFRVVCKFSESVLALESCLTHGRGGGEGRVPSLINAAVEREVSDLT
jgi:hypothetical protein